MAGCSKLRKSQCNTKKCMWIIGKRCRKKAATVFKCPRTLEYNSETKKCSKIKIKQILVESSKKSSSRLPILKCPPGELLLPDESLCKSIDFVGSGSFGCVITPPVFSKEYIIHEDIPYTNRANDDISKIFKKKQKHYEKELSILKKIQQIDPENKFTAKLKGAQHISPDALQGNSKLQQCLKNASNTYYQIILENGGKQLDAVYSIKYKDFLRLFTTFLEGMLSLQKKKLIHRDIKPLNVLITPTKINLIDWGLYCYAKELFDAKNEHVLAYEYPYYPPEFYVAYILLHYKDIVDGNQQVFHTYLDKILPTMIHKGYFKHSYITQPLFMIYYKGVAAFINAIKQRGYSSYAEVFNEDLAYKTDVFPIAHLLEALDNNMIYSNHAQKDFVHELYKKCIDCNPYTRISFQELHKIVARENSQYQTAGKKKSS